MFFDNHRDACMRLDGTIIKYGGKASQVVHVNEDLKLVLRVLSTNEEVVVGQKDEGVELIAPTLGYVNTREQAFYAMRKPARMWKQGLPVRNLYYKDVRRPVRADIVNLALCLDGVYPSLEEASKGFVSTNPFDPHVPKSIAFSKHWAIRKNGELEYKGKVVGKVGDKPMLEDKYIWLAESLAETLNAEG